MCKLTLSKHVVQASLNVCTSICMFVCPMFYLYVENWYCHYAFAIVKNENVYMRVLIKNLKKKEREGAYISGHLILSHFETYNCSDVKTDLS